MSAVLVLLMGASGFAQGLADMQWFAPVNDSRYGGGYRPNEGYFFAFDGLLWHIGTPDVTTIGKEGLTREVFYHTSDAPFDQFNSNDTSELDARVVTPGNRYEFGYMSGHQGWVSSSFFLRTETQRLTYSAVDVVIDDNPFRPATSPPASDATTGLLAGWVADVLTWTSGSATYDNIALLPLPVTFDYMYITNKVETWGTELMYKYRMHPGHHGGIFEFFMGPRYMEFNEDFNVYATGDRFYVPSGDPTTSPAFGPRTILADSSWYTSADNHIIGPQVGARWFHRSGRFTISTEGRFFAGWNLQNLRQKGVLGDKLDTQFSDNYASGGLPDPLFAPDIMEASPFTHKLNRTVWCPAAELRVEGKYQLSRSITFRVGWTGMWLDGIARASNVIDYQISQNSYMGLKNDRQGLFVNGATFGLDLNY